MEKFIKSEVISLQNHPNINEKWIQNKIAEDPSLIGLGELVLKDTERLQPRGGRLDLLLYDPEINRRYEVELQLGKSDESHIIRTIEYWDYQRKKFPQYDHCAVLIAEDITSRFLNVISLFNGNIPIIAIQMKALRIQDEFTLFFTTVLDELSFGTEEEEIQEVVDRKYWEKLGTEKSVQIVDKIKKYVDMVAPGYSLNYNKHYIGLCKDGISQNFVAFVPRKKATLLHIKHEPADEIEEILSNTDFDVLAYDRHFKEYRIRLNDEDVKNNEEILSKLIKMAYDSYRS